MNTNKVPVVKARSTVEIEYKAMAFLKLTYPDLLKKPAPFPGAGFFDSGKITEILNYDYGIENLNDAEAYTDFDNKRLVLNKNVYEGLHTGCPRALFTLAHEISHIILHSNEIRYRIFNNCQLNKLNRSKIITYRDPEWQANAGAAALLMPWPTMLNIIKEKKLNLFEMATKYNVSYTAASIRMAKYDEYLSKKKPPAYFGGLTSC